MPIIAPNALRHIGCQLFEAVGCSPDDARTVTEHLVESSLFGHDSHGIIRFYEYVQFIRDGIWNPRGEPQVIQERPCTAVIDGGGAMGQVGGAFAVQVAVSKAREHGTATVSLRNCCHVGRCGAYTLMVARQGLVGLMFINAGRLGRQIAPYGGIDGRLSTNPISFAAPRRNHNPVMVDMATSMSAEGKIRVARNKGETLPEGWIIDHQGRPSVDPAAYLDEPQGAILPLGGTAAHKGYCLSVIVELLGGALGGEGCANGARTMQSNGVVLTVHHIEHFNDMETYYDEVEILVDHIHSSRIDSRIGQIQIPGEPEFCTSTERSRKGIPIDETTWHRICEAGRSLDLQVDHWG